jgi:uncharacterized membrane protein YcaP (DUF421 family)
MKWQFLGIEVKDNAFRNFFYHDYLKTFLQEDYTDMFMQLFTVFVLVLFGMFAMRLVGKKSISQMTLPNVLFVFLFTSALGGLVASPQHLIIALIITGFIIFMVIVLEYLSRKFNKVERIFAGYPSVVYKDGEINITQLKKENLTVDQLEGLVRESGIPSMKVCKQILLEPNGKPSIELLPEFEPVRKIYFDEAIKQILKALGEKYKEAEMPEMNNLFEEAVKKRNKDESVEGGNLD